MYLTLNPQERRICYLLFWGYAETEIAADLGSSFRAVQAVLYRCRRREGLDNTLGLVCRYVEEYLGVGEAFGERPLPESLEPARTRAAAA